MNKFLTIALSASIATFALTGCQKDDSDKQATQSSQALPDAQAYSHDSAASGASSTVATPTSVAAPASSSTAPASASSTGAKDTSKKSEQK